MQTSKRMKIEKPCVGRPLLGPAKISINGLTLGNLEFDNFDWKGLTYTSKDMTKTTRTCHSELKPCRDRTIGRANNGRVYRIGFS